MHTYVFSREIEIEIERRERLTKFQDGHSFSLFLMAAAAAAVTHVWCF
jgi:hypothetical protein